MRTRAEVGPAIQASASGPARQSSLPFSPDGQTLATAAHGVQLGRSLRTHRSGRPSRDRGCDQGRLQPRRPHDRRSRSPLWEDQPLLLRDPSSGESFDLPLRCPPRLLLRERFCVQPRRESPRRRRERRVNRPGHFRLRPRDAHSGFATSATRPELNQGLVYSPDGQTLVSAGVYGVENLGRRDRRRTGTDVRRRQLDVTAIALSPDGRLLAAARSDGSIQFWALDARTENGPAPSASDGSNRARLQPRRPHHRFGERRWCPPLGRGDALTDRRAPRRRREQAPNDRAAGGKGSWPSGATGRVSTNFVSWDSGRNALPMRVPRVLGTTDGQPASPRYQAAAAASASSMSCRPLFTERSDSFTHGAAPRHARPLRSPRRRARLRALFVAPGHARQPLRCPLGAAPAPLGLASPAEACDNF